MEQNALRYFESLKDKRVAVLGIGVSHRPLVRLLCKFGAKVTAFDAKTDAIDSLLKAEFSSLGVDFSLGSGYLEKLDHEIIFKTPGMRFDIPELEKAREKGSIVTSEMEVFFDICPAKIIAVTGSDGKTTTTTLIYKLLSEAGYRCRLGGNIGNPLLPEIEDITPEEIIVLELSSFQLHSMKKSPDIAVVTNLTPNHLDVHKSMEEYIDAKRNILRSQTEKNIAVLNSDNDITAGFAADTPGRTIFFSRKKILENGIFLNNDMIYDARKGQEPVAVLDRKDIALRGNHNIENYMAAYGAVRELISQDVFLKVAKSFQGVPHRIELVRKWREISFYNDSIATSPTRCMAALDSFDKPLVLIAGGYDKRLSFNELGRAISEKVKVLVLTGQTAGKIRKAVIMSDTFSKDKTAIYTVEDFDEAVKLAARKAKSGDTVLLSPACASFDRFKNFEIRGERFREIIMSL